MTATTDRYRIEAATWPTIPGLAYGDPEDDEETREHKRAQNAHAYIRAWRGVRYCLPAKLTDRVSACPICLDVIHETDPAVSTEPACPVLVTDPDALAAGLVRLVGGLLVPAGSTRRYVHEECAARYLTRVGPDVMRRLRHEARARGESA